MFLFLFFQSPPYLFVFPGDNAFRTNKGFPKTKKGRPRWRWQRLTLTHTTILQYGIRQEKNSCSFVFFSAEAVNEYTIYSIPGACFGGRKHNRKRRTSRTKRMLSSPECESVSCQRSVQADKGIRTRTPMKCVIPAQVKGMYRRGQRKTRVVFFSSRQISKRIHSCECSWNCYDKSIFRNIYATYRATSIQRAL